MHVVVLVSHVSKHLVLRHVVTVQGIPTLPELKLRYYELMIVYYQHYHNYLEICRCYKAIYESDGVQADPALWQPVSVQL